MSMKITVRLERADWERFQKHVQKEIRRSAERPFAWHIGNILLWAVLAVVGLTVLDRMGGFHWPTAVFVGSVFLVIAVQVVYDVQRIARRFAPSDEGPFVGEHRFEISEQGIESEAATYHATHAWSVVKRIERVDGVTMVFLDTAFAFLFPEDRLDDPDAFFSYLNACHSAG